MQHWLWKLKTPLIALAILAMGLVFLYVFGQVDTLRCRRGEGGLRCDVTTTWMNSVSLRQQELAGLRQASIEDSCDSDGCTYRVYLITDRGGRALNSVYTSDLSGQQAIAGRINNFLNGSQPSLEVSSGGGWLIIIPGLLLLAGLVVAVVGFRGLLNPE